MSDVLVAIALGAVAVIGLSMAPLFLTRRTGLLLAVSAAAALVLTPRIALFGAVAVMAAWAVDAVAIRARPRVVRSVPSTLARGVPSTVEITAELERPGRVRIRQPAVPDVGIRPAEQDGRLAGELVARRRGRHRLPPVATRTDGPLGLASWYRSERDVADLSVYPDLPAAQRLVLAIRQGRFRDPGLRTRGPMGLGTDFESIRDYLPDDDVRQINWRATQRVGRPMSNQYRVEQDRDVVCVVDTGRLMGAPIGDLTRLDAALDAVVAVALVVDELGDRAGVVAFSDTIRRRLTPRRRGGDAVVQAVFDLEPDLADADYEAAFRAVGGGKRALVLVFTDLLDEAAATALIDAMPVLTRRHVVVVVSATDPDLDDLVHDRPGSLDDVYSAAAALDVLGERERVAGMLRGMGADVIDVRRELLAGACVAAYVTAKARARL